MFSHHFDYSSVANSIFHEDHSQNFAMFVDRTRRDHISCQRSLIAVEDRLQHLTVAQLGTSDFRDHLNIFRSKIETASSAIENPAARHLLDRELKSAFSKLVSELSKFSNETENQFNQEVQSCMPSLSDASANATSSKNQACSKLLSSFSSKSRLGSIHLITVTTACSQEQFPQSNTFSTILVLHPSQWLQYCGVRKGIRMELLLSSTGLSCNLKPYHAVPDDSSIFMYCRDGNVEAVKTLFGQRKASPWDTNSRGFTPLFVGL
jgi:hypothetical protein